MKILVIPDVHLKPHMFRQAATLLEAGAAEQAVCLMDLPDDWNQQFNISLYEETYDAAIHFARQYPQTRWCYGNHDLCYLWNERETGYSSLAAYTVQRKLLELSKAVTAQDEANQIRYIHRIDNVIFSHGGLHEEFVRDHVKGSLYDNVDAVLEVVNALGRRAMWQDASPIWLRPQYGTMRMYKPRKLLQVVGHTPMDEITRLANVLSCDVFSTYRDGSPIGTEEFCVVDTKTWEWNGVKATL